MIDELNPFENPIIIKCEGAAVLPFEKLIDFQGNLKRLTVENRKKLMNSIMKKGFCVPIFIWNNKGKYLCLDGHQRIKTLAFMKSKGWTIPEIPVAYIHADNVKDAKEKLLYITSQYGEFEKDELDQWLEDIDKDLIEDLRLLDEEIAILIPDFKETDGEDQGQLDELEPKIITCPHCGEEFDARQN